MKLSSLTSFRPLSVRGFTLPETITAVGIFVLLVGAVVSSQVFGLRMYKISETKLSTTAEARNALNRVRSEVWAGRKVQVGKADGISFELLPVNSPQRGNGLRIYPADNTNSYVYYYLDSNDTCLKRVVSGRTNLEIVADYVTNQIGFQLEDYQGNVVSNSLTPNRVVRMTLQFYKREFAVASGKNANRWIGESFQLQTRVTRRAID